MGEIREERLARTLDEGWVKLSEAIIQLYVLDGDIQDIDEEWLQALCELAGVNIEEVKKKAEVRFIF